MLTSLTNRSPAIYTTSLPFSMCNMGRLECTEIECSATCSLVGYNHVTTFDGQMYDFDVGDTECTYSLVQVRAYTILIVVNNKPMLVEKVPRLFAGID